MSIFSETSRLNEKAAVKHFHAWTCLEEVNLTGSVQALLSGMEGWVANENCSKIIIKL